MPSTDGDIVDLLRTCKVSAKGAIRVVIEDVPWVVGSRVSPASTAKLHRNVGVIHGALHALGIRIELVRPQIWQRFFSLGTRKAHGDKWKSCLKAEAQRRFPHLTVTYATADALLILDWAERWRPVWRPEP